MYSMPDLQGSVPLLDVKHDTEPEAEAANVNSYVTVAARNWCKVPTVAEATTTKDGEFRCACSV